MNEAVYKPAAAVFVHGIFSTPAVWKPLVDKLAADPVVNASLCLKCFGYNSPKISLNPLTRVPNLSDVATSLATYLDTESELRRCDRIALIGHSQGGLVIQTFLAERLFAGDGERLARIRGVMMLATPNTGSQLFISLRQWFDHFAVWRNNQERYLRPFDELVERVRKKILEDVIYSAAPSNAEFPIPFRVFSGETDGVVPPHSARWVFPDAGQLPGDHVTILTPREGGQLVGVVRELLMRVRHSFPADGTHLKTEAFDPSKRQDVDDLVSLMTTNFDPSARVKVEDIRHWLENYQESWELRLAVVVGKINNRLKACLMFHESREMIVVDYIVAETAGLDGMLTKLLLDQLRNRAKSLDGAPLVFEVQDPRHAGIHRVRASARIELFQRQGARIIGDVSYLAPDMESMRQGEEVPYLLMHWQFGPRVEALAGADVCEYVRRLYTVWYLNWFSNRPENERRCQYLHQLSEQVCKKIPAGCRLVTLDEL